MYFLIAHVWLVGFEYRWVNTVEEVKKKHCWSLLAVSVQCHNLKLRHTKVKTNYVVRYHNAVINNKKLADSWLKRSLFLSINSIVIILRQQLWPLFEISRRPAKVYSGFVLKYFIIASISQHNHERTIYPVLDIDKKIF